VYDPVTFEELRGGSRAVRSTNACYARATVRRIMTRAAAPGFNRDPLTRQEYSADDRAAVGLPPARHGVEHDIPLLTWGMSGTVVVAALAEQTSEVASARNRRALMHAMRELGALRREDVQADAARYAGALASVCRVCAIALQARALSQL
jgi:hypothetical protein